MEPEQARCAARRAFGWVDVKQAHRDARGLPLLETLAADVRHTLSLAVGRVAAAQLSALLFEVSATDLAPLGGAVSAMLAVTALAACLPARRAANVDPIAALRCE
jgi:ABC-type lipoprotein release transport system permease subunit